MDFEDIEEPEELVELGKTICPKCKQAVPDLSDLGWTMHLESWMCQRYAGGESV